MNEINVPVQWGLVVEHTRHQDRARARLCGDLGDLGSASMVEPGKNQSLYSLELECSLVHCCTDGAVCNHHLLSVSASEFVLFFKIGPRNLNYSAWREKIACAHK